MEGCPRSLHLIKRFDRRLVVNVKKTPPSTTTASKRGIMPKRRSALAARSAPPIPTVPVVGIGASAGGLNAFRRFLSTLPNNSGAAFVLIQHLDPARESRAAEYVGTHTDMPSLKAAHGMVIKKNHVYVIPPNADLSIANGTLRLGTPTNPRNGHMAIDHFFASLAKDQSQLAVGIVLSGSGSDGSAGLKAIQAAGGLTMVQDPATAQYEAMPRSALAAADHVLPAEQLADVLMRHLHGDDLPGDHLHGDPLSGLSAGMRSHPLTGILTLLRARTHIDFDLYKRSMVLRRIRHRMSLHRVAALAAYGDMLRNDTVESAALVGDLLVNVTSFFRDPAAWDVLRRDVVKPLLAEKADGGSLRVWAPACATGEEAYSLAMMCIEEMEESEKGCRLQVFASDINAESLEMARVGVYPESLAKQVGPERLARFFVPVETGYQVTKALRNTVVFARQDVLKDPPFSRLDLVICRNLLIYLKSTVQEKLLPLLHRALVKGGHLFLGGAEGIGTHEDLFEAVSTKRRIYRRLSSTKLAQLRFPSQPEVLPALHDRSHDTRPFVRLGAAAHKLLLQRYAAACVIIHRDGDILYYQGSVHDYLWQPDGVATHDLFAQARPGLRGKLRSVVRDAFDGHRRVQVTGIRMRRGSGFAGVTITVEPLPSVDEVEGLWLVSMEDEVPSDAAPDKHVATDAASRNDDAALVYQLEYELKTSKEDLQQSVGELRASNEELMSMNEEFQSTNEELEFSKAELESLNTELASANSQLESKIAEVKAANNDLDNLLTSTEIATLFLDRDLCVRRFTEAATGLFRLISTDIGRSIADIAQVFTDPTLLIDAAAVLEDATPRQMEVQAHNGRWYVRQVLPYRTRDNQIRGVVVTLSDVAAEALLEARLYAEAIVDTVREPLLVLNQDLNVISANRSFYATFQLAEKSTIGALLYELGGGEWDIPKLRTLLGEILPEKHVLNDFEMEHDFVSTIGPRTMLLNARTLLGEGDRQPLILLAIEDVTERRRLEAALQESEARKRTIEATRQRGAELAHALRVSTIGELASGLAHELHQPLAAIAYEVAACSHYIRSGKADSVKLLALLDEATSEALRAGEIVGHLRSFIEKGAPQFELVDLNDIVRSVGRLLRHELEREQITLRLDLTDRPLPIQADRIQIEQVTVNLVQNAMAALQGVPPERREIHVCTRVAKRGAELTVRDRGVGISVEVEERLFEPFFTTKSTGLGMGLSISRSIIDAHKGRVWVRPLRAEGEEGSEVSFSIPLKAASKLRKTTRPSAVRSVT